ncbi:prolipoprotein diacylglyceryl transferase [Candidatus Woesearchaeota archaeon CG10_big_fil_rev_8_21_14_0_10_34_8]|nr:MAG: prolipoprotein diacylglyceryl transferase [Candidatus Woesearchaeota archaeon CG10_big_fil_rev_8_21_14_0_10_34_8]
MTYIHNINPVLFSIGSLEVRYYGLAYVVGILLGYFIIKHLIKKKEIDITSDELDDLILYIALGVLIGSRLFYFLFYNFSSFIQNPLIIFKIWQGGMSFHGGLIGVITAGYIFCKRYNKNFFELADLCVIPTAIALGLGRITNFINGELYGRPTSLPWGVDFGDGVYRHPSQLYEAGKNFVIFGILWFLKNKDLKKGTLFWAFITMYGTFRFFIEFGRQPDPQLGFVLFNFFTMGQVLTAIMAILGTFMLMSMYSKK